MDKPNYELVAIGDLAVDAFIKLSEAHVACGLDRENCQLCLDFGGKIPYEDVYTTAAVGNSPNVAVALSRLGHRVALVSNIGDDRYGKHCLDTLEKEKISTEFIAVHENQKTNYHYVLWFGSDRTILVKHEEYDYTLPNIESPAWIYLSSLGENSLAFHQKISDYLADHSETKLAFSPGTFQLKLGYEQLKNIYARTEILFCNQSEARKILDTEDQSLESLTLAEQIAELGPKIVVITNGDRGALAYSAGQVWTIGVYQGDGPVIERTGAGDSFTGAFLAALLDGKEIGEAITWGPINAQAVIQEIGAHAGLLTKDELENKLHAAKDSFQPQKMEKIKQT